MIRAPLLLFSISAMLAGCTSLGGTVRGDFSCRAPEGTCAPLTVNDAQALSALASRTSPRVQPIVRARRVTDAVARTGERLLTVMLPAHVDDSGVLHDAATVHVVAEPSRWSDPLPTAFAPLTVPSRSVAPSLREVTAGAFASAVEGPGVSPGRAPQPSDAPSASAIDAARSGHRIARPALPLLPDGAESVAARSQLPVQPLIHAPLTSPGADRPGIARPEAVEPRR